MKFKVSSLLIMVSILFFFVSPVFAMENYVSGPLVDKLRSYKEVSEAFKRRGQREKTVNKLLKDGMCGETNIGFLLTRFMNIPEEDRAVLEAENRDRQVIMIGIARALLEVAGQPVTDDTVKAKLPVAIKFFCDLREKVVPDGTWIQNPDGEWSQKH